MQKDANYYRNLIGEHWFENNYLDEKIKSIPEGKSFIFLADPHVRNTNLMHSPALIGYIRATSDVKKVIVGGDYIHIEETAALALAEMKDYIGKMRDVAGDDLLVVMGNHDFNNPNSNPNALVEDFIDKVVRYQDLEDVLMSGMKTRVCEDVSEKIAYLNCSDEEKQELIHYSRLHFHIDNPETKIRYIMLNTGAPRICNPIWKFFGVSVFNELILQYDWLYETLMSTPKDYDVVISAHQLYFSKTSDFYPVVLQLMKMISGFRAKQKVTVSNVHSDNEKITPYYAAGDHEYDFSDSKASGNLVVMAADLHWDAQQMADFDADGSFKSKPYEGEELSETGVVVNVVQTDSLGCSRYEKAYEMTEGTNTEQCFDIVTIKPDGSVKLTRIGAGIDREVRVKQYHTPLKKHPL